MSYINKYVISVLVILIIIVFIMIFGFFIQKDKPLNIIEGKLKIKLPTSVNIVNYNYNRKEDNFDAKILINNESVDYVKKELNVFFGGKAPNKVIEKLPNFKNESPWWDLDKQNIEISYKKFVNGEKKLFGYSPKTRVVWAFISKDKNGQYYLYISY